MSNELKRGARIAGRYVIDREVARGGNATVYVARDHKLHNQVAIKVLESSLASPAAIARFLREVRLAARLVHTNIVQIFDTGAVDGLPYYVMPFVEGETLRRLLERENRLPLQLALRITREVADALTYAHAARIVHRDIKPENILMADGHAMLADFGIARAMTAANTDPRTGARSDTTAERVVGTPQYMSPEQHLGDEAVDGRTDIYSLATVLFEMLTAMIPFGGRNAAEMAARKLTEDPPSLSELRGDVPPGVDAAIRCALDRRPERRYATAHDLVDALAAGASLEPPPAADDGKPSIAVLPFESIPEDEAWEYYGVGMTDEVIRALGRLRRLNVVSRFSVFALKRPYGDVRELSRKLNAKWIVAGTITRRGTRLRIVVNLDNGADGYSEHLGTFEEESSEAMEMQDEIAQAVADSVRPTLLGAPPPARERTSVETYTTYLLGRSYWNRRTPAGLDLAAEAFHSVIESDPGLALGHAGLADVQHSRCVYSYAPPLDTLPLARESAVRALELDPFAAEPHAALGAVRAVLDWDWREAAAEFRRAIALDPTYTSAYGWFANYVLLPLGRFDEAFAELSRARLADPLSAHIGSSFGMLYYYSRRYGEAEAECRAVEKYAPFFLIAHYFLGRSLVERGRFEEGLEAFRRVDQLAGGHPHVPTERGYAYAKQGDRERALREVQLLKGLSEHRYVSSCFPALIHAALGDVDAAMEGFERGLREHSTDLLWLGVHPGLDGMREDPRFQALLRRVGLEGG